MAIDYAGVHLGGGQVEREADGFELLPALYKIRKDL